MGLPIIGHLVRAASAPWQATVDPKKRAEVEKRGATWHTDLAGKCDVILVCVGLRP